MEQLTLFDPIPEPPRNKKTRAPRQSKKSVLNDDQMQLTYRPHELMSKVKDSVDKYEDENMEDLWDAKRSEILNSTKYEHIYEDIKQNGIRYPVTLQDTGAGTPWVMGQGHHRVVMAELAEQETGKPFYIPVVHSEDWDESTHYELKDNYERPNKMKNTSDYKEHLVEHHSFRPSDFGANTHSGIMKTVHEREHEGDETNYTKTGSHFHKYPYL